MIVSKYPEKAAKSLPLFDHFDYLYLYVHVDQRHEFQDELDKLKLNARIVVHGHERVGGKTPMGALRHHPMRLLQAWMQASDLAVVSDDDVEPGKIRLADGTRREFAPGSECRCSLCPGYRFLTIDSGAFAGEVASLAAEARNGGFPYFTGSFNGQAHGPYRPYRVFRAQTSWSGMFGFFKDSPNVFDPAFPLGADYAAQAQLIAQTHRKAVLAHTGLLMDYGINTAAYDAPAENRRENLERLVAQYANFARRGREAVGLYRLTENTKTSRHTGAVSLKIPREVSNLLKRNVDERYR